MPRLPWDVMGKLAFSSAQSQLCSPQGVVETLDGGDTQHRKKLLQEAAGVLKVGKATDASASAAAAAEGDGGSGAQQQPPAKKPKKMGASKAKAAPSGEA